MNAVNEQEPVSPHNAVLLLVDQPYVVESERTYKGETIAGHFRGHPGLGHRPRQMAAHRRAVHLSP